MKSLSAAHIVRLWELGQGKHPLDQALTCLAFALPDQPLDTLASLSLGRRDGYLLTLRELTFGPQLDSVATCPSCQETLEFALQVGDIRAGDPAVPLVEPVEWKTDDLRLKFRLPNSLDLAATVGLVDVDGVRQRMLERCVLAVSQGEQALAVADLPETVLTQVEQAIAAADPQSDITLDLACPTCGHNWQVLFDIGEFLWAEITAYAQRLLLDTHQLACTYGWAEADILAMSNQRRQYYLGLMSHG
jgi:hypothetical protein